VIEVRYSYFRFIEDRNDDDVYKHIELKMADEHMAGAEDDDVQFMRTVNNLFIHSFVILSFRKIIYA
jgi:hypothetical protein